jgi:hypothetical protein|tara:strand:- start:2461 stop:2592 length:132 start_codon:yes stop_codon:yes gene_type:complete
VGIVDTAFRDVTNDFKGCQYYFQMLSLMLAEAVKNAFRGSNKL